MENYQLKILYDNGIEKTYDIGEMSESEINDILNFVKESFQTGNSAFLQLPVENSLSVFNLSKVSEVNFISVEQPTI
ncbi:hypothetical protein [Paraliobacillus ryukyuensis]|uniref:hypothetical protein n=1 Tax=Paraliobacillus ryukyuensis TaxID=200904 RepID=UPI0009A8FEC2|nr:hypothetical protein [Paraliobacillus ryukyuensis]